MKINMETKFDIGQEVYVIQKARAKEPCAACNGQGHIKIEGNDFSCTSCFGTGRLHGKRKIYQLLGKDTITSIKIFNELLNADRHHAYIMYVQDYVLKVEKRITLITASIAININQEQG